jgi:hypothetical protein
MGWVMGGILIASAAFCFVLAMAAWLAERKELLPRPGEPARRSTPITRGQLDDPNWRPDPWTKRSVPFFRLPLKSGVYEPRPRRGFEDPTGNKSRKEEHP